MSRVTSKGQVTIPKEVRDRFGLRPGTEVAFVEEDGRLVVKKADAPDDLDAWMGALDLPEGVDAWIEAARGRQPPPRPTPTPTSTAP